MSIRHSIALSACLALSALAFPFGAAAQDQQDPAAGDDEVTAPEETTEETTEEAAEAGAEDAPDAEEIEDAPPVEAEEVPANVVEAEERLDRGINLMQEGDYDAALAEFEQAYELVGDHPTRYQLLYNIGRAHELRFRYDLALEYYRRFLDEGGEDVPNRPAVEASMRTLEGLLATLVIEVNAPSAEVWVDDRHVGDAPGRVLVPGGRHIVEVRAEGFTDARQEVQIAPREEQSLAFELEELAEEYSGISPVFFWSSIGVAAASVVVGSVFGIMAVSERNSVDDIINDPVRRWDSALLQEKKDRIDNLALTADIFFGAAVLFGATAVVLALFTNWDGESETADATDETAGLRLTVQPVFSPTAAGLVLGGAL